MCGSERSPSSPTVIGQLPWERFDLDEKKIENRDLDASGISWLNHSAVIVHLQRVASLWYIQPLWGKEGSGI